MDFKNLELPLIPVYASGFLNGKLKPKSPTRVFNRMHAYRPTSLLQIAQLNYICLLYQYTPNMKTNASKFMEILYQVSRILSIFANHRHI